MADDKSSNRTVWIVICLIAALLCGCVMGTLVGGLAGFGIGRRAAVRSGHAAPSERVMPSSGGITGRLPSAENGAVIITRVVKASPAEKAGLLDGDIITALDGQSLTGDDTLANRLLRYTPGDAVIISVVRANRQQSFTVVLGANPSQSTRAWIGIYYQQAPTIHLQREPDSD
ncbi:MAG: PDZ domain-containing protein [Anaerolineae bacterium]